MRISIIGQPASGKTFLAKRIAEKLGIPHLHLDRLYFEAGGRKARKTEAGRDAMRAYIREKVKESILQDSWVSDGFYSRQQPLIVERADVVLFLDIPFHRRVFGHIYRALYEERHQELHAWDEVRFIFEMITRVFTRGPKIRAFVQAHKTKVVRLRSFREIDRYLENL